MKSCVSVFVISILMPLSSFAASSWQCDGGTLEGLNVGEVHGELSGDVSWDCFPGDGICNQQSAVRQEAGDEGETVFVGPYFKLTIETSKALNSEGEYNAHIVAKDMTDASDEGRGFTLDQDISCQKK
jgi:hypothetical protein